MKIAYIDKKFQKNSLDLIGQANEIIEEYQVDGYDLTLRQLYYQFVARDIIANKQSEYKRLGSVINDARLAGLIDWDSIVDRTRDFERLSHWNSPAEILQSAADSYGIDTRANQKDYVEVWVEKDALIGVIEKACNPLDVGFLSCRGYVSQSTMWRAAERFIKQAVISEENYIKHGLRKTILIHLGDHDPSGIDMTRDIQDRLKIFGASVTVQRIALTMEQIEDKQPPPNPAKTTDSRYESYIAEYGEESWELDALDPRFLVDLIKEEIALHTQFDLREKLIKKQEKERKAIRKVADNWDHKK